MSQNKILTTFNQALTAQLYDLQNPDASPVQYSTLNGLPLGTKGNASDGELGLKVVIIEDRSGGAGSSSSGQPYGADAVVIDPLAAGPNTIQYYQGGTGGTLLKTRTFTYNGSGGTSPSDQCTGFSDT